MCRDQQTQVLCSAPCTPGVEDCLKGYLARHWSNDCIFLCGRQELPLASDSVFGCCSLISVPRTSYHVQTNNTFHSLAAEFELFGGSQITNHTAHHGRIILNQNHVQIIVISAHILHTFL